MWSCGPSELITRVRYNPYGTMRTQEGTALPTDKLFTGQQRETTAIYNYGARFYNADIGRFLSADSIVPSAGDPQALNRYSYVLNNPIRYSDPTGQRPADDPCWLNGKSDCSGIPSGPVAQALEIVTVAPYSIDQILGGCEFCAFHNKWLMERTPWAVATLHDAGWQLHMLPWADRTYVAELVQGLYGSEALERWYHTPSPAQMKEYMLAGLAAGSIGSSGFSSLFTPGGSYMGKAELGSFWKQFKADFDAGNLQNWRVETVTANPRTSSNYSRTYSSAINSEVKITNLQTRQFTYGQLQWKLEFSPSGVPYIRVRELHMRPYPKLP